MFTPHHRPLRFTYVKLQLLLTEGGSCQDQLLRVDAPGLSVKLTCGLEARRSIGPGLACTCQMLFKAHLMYSKSLNRTYGTFTEGSVTLSTGPWGPFTGSTSRDTFPFGKLLKIGFKKKKTLLIVHKTTRAFLSLSVHVLCVSTHLAASCVWRRAAGPRPGHMCFSHIPAATPRSYSCFHRRCELRWASGEDRRLQEK